MEGNSILKKDMEYIDLSSLPINKRRSFTERYLISPEFENATNKRGLFS